MTADLIFVTDITDISMEKNLSCGEISDFQFYRNLCRESQNVTANYSKVRWSGEHVPGSPFVTMIFDTEEELARFTPNLMT